MARVDSVEPENEFETALGSMSRADVRSEGVWRGDGARISFLPSRARLRHRLWLQLHQRLVRVHPESVVHRRHGAERPVRLDRRARE